MSLAQVQQLLADGDVYVIPFCPDCFTGIVPHGYHIVVYTPGEEPCDGLVLHGSHEVEQSRMWYATAYYAFLKT